MDEKQDKEKAKDGVSPLNRKSIEDLPIDAGSENMNDKNVIEVPSDDEQQIFETLEREKMKARQRLVERQKQPIIKGIEEIKASQLPEMQMRVKTNEDEGEAKQESSFEKFQRFEEGQDAQGVGETYEQLYGQKKEARDTSAEEEGEEEESSESQEESESEDEENGDKGGKQKGGGEAKGEKKEGEKQEGKQTTQAQGDQQKPQEQATKIIGDQIKKQAWAMFFIWGWLYLTLCFLVGNLVGFKSKLFPALSQTEPPGLKIKMMGMLSEMIVYCVGMAIIMGILLIFFIIIFVVGYCATHPIKCGVGAATGQ